MKIITTIVVGIIILLLFFSITNSPDPATPVVVPETAQSQDNFHPLSIDALRLRQFPPQQFRSVATVTPNSEIVSYQSDDLTLRALKIVPASPPPVGGYPVVIVNHGHIPPDQYSVTRSYINTSNYFASQGFLVLKPDYRGHDDSDGQTPNRLFSRAAYTVDVLNLLSALDSLPDINSQKIFMYGHSMGGDITLQVLAISSRITAATLWAPAVTSLPDQITHFMNKNRTSPTGTPFQTLYDEFINSYSISQISAVDHLDKITTPLNLHHATADESVPYQWGTDLDAKLKTLGKTVNFYGYPGDNHDIAGNFGTALSRDTAFFKSFL